MAEGNESQDLNIERGTLQGAHGLNTQQSQQPATTDEVSGEAANTSPPPEVFEDDRAAETQNHSHPAHNVGVNGMSSESSANQETYHMRRSDFSQDFYALAMENANDCEHIARELQTMYHLFTVKLRSASLRMELPRPMRSASQARHGDVHDTSKVLKTAVTTTFVASRQKCRDLLSKIHHFGKIAWDQHKLICDIGDELDRVVYALEEQQRVNKDILEQLHSAHEAQRGGGGEMDTLENTQDTSMGENTTEENSTRALSELATDDNVDWGSPSTDSELLTAVKNAIDM